MAGGDEEFIMTIDSDVEIDQEDSSDDEQEKVVMSKVSKTKEVFDQSFEFDETNARSKAPTGCSWDFTKAIKRIEQARLDAGEVLSMRTSVKEKVAKTLLQEKLTVNNVLLSSDHTEEEEEQDVIVEEEKLQQAITEQQAEDVVEAKKAAAYFEADSCVEKRDTFDSLKLSRPLLRAVATLGFTSPTPIQQRAIPVAMMGKDLCASAQTGSGKTAAFILPVLERLQYRKTRATRVLIVCPVRELATQCQSMIEQLAQYMSDLSCSLVVGGLPLKAQEVELRNQPDIVVCTPGRMIDHLRNSKSVHLDELEILILDEADRLLELGFTDEIQELLRNCPAQRQTMLFSATMTSKVDQLIQLSMKRPVRIDTDPLYDVAKHLVQEFVRIRPTRESDREAVLLALCCRTFKTNTMVFLEYKRHCHRLMILFHLAGLKAAELHGNLSQEERLHSLQQFRDGTVDFLLCTDVAARGIDVEGVNAVINYEMPKDITTYVHRVGRTARAGRTGRAVTLTSESRRLITKQVARNCTGIVKSRAIPPKVIDQWKEKIESLENQLSEILEQEKVENQMKNAQKEMKRASNLVEFQHEIFNRPKRTWFQTEKEKKEIKEKVVDAQEIKITRDIKRCKKKQLVKENEKKNRPISDVLSQSIKKRKRTATFETDLSSNTGPGRKKEFEFQEKITSLRKGGKKSVNSFKSRKRYNRKR